MANKSGATLVELVVTISIIAIIAAVTAGMIISVLQLFVYLPQEMKARSIAQDLVDIMVEGEPNLRGMRYSTRIITATPSQFSYQTFVAGYPGARREMRLTWNNSTKKIYRSWVPVWEYIPPGMEIMPPLILPAIIPYYANNPNISIVPGSGNPANTIFRYYLANGAEWTSGADLYNIKRVDIAIRVYTGSGVFKQWQGSFEIKSSVEIKQFI